MKKSKIIFAYIIGIIAWIIGVFVGGLWGALENNSSGNNIDVIGVLCETLTPAILSVILSNYIFKNRIKDYKNRTFHIIVLNVILICCFVYVLAQTLLITEMYENIIYVIAGITTSIVCININMKDKQ